MNENINEAIAEVYAEMHQKIQIVRDVQKTFGETFRRHFDNIVGTLEDRAKMKCLRLNNMRDALGITLPANNYDKGLKDKDSCNPKDKDSCNPKDNLLEEAWNLICNAGQGNWKNESQEWQEAAIRLRKRLHPLIKVSRIVVECNKAWPYKIVDPELMQSVQALLGKHIVDLLNIIRGYNECLELQEKEDKSPEHFGIMWNKLAAFRKNAEERLKFWEELV